MKKAKRITITLLCSIGILGSLAFSLSTRNKVSLFGNTYGISEIIEPSTNKEN